MSKIDYFTKFTLTELTKYLNDNFKKEKRNRQHISSEFTFSDVQGYIKRGFLPRYLTEGVKVNIVKYDRYDLKVGKFYQLKEMGLPEDIEMTAAIKQGAVKVPTREEKIEEILASDLTKTKKIVALGDLGLTRTEVLNLKFVDPTLVYDMYRYMFPNLCNNL